MLYLQMSVVRNFSHNVGIVFVKKASHPRTGPGNILLFKKNFKLTAILEYLYLNLKMFNIFISLSTAELEYRYRSL